MSEETKQKQENLEQGHLEQGHSDLAKESEKENESQKHNGQGQNEGEEKLQILSIDKAIKQNPEMEKELKEIAEKIAQGAINSEIEGQIIEGQGIELENLQNPNKTDKGRQ
jgi:hypothetical protein